MWRVIVFIGLVLGFAPVSHGDEANDDWPMYGRDLRRTFSNSHSRINPRSISRLKPAWSFVTDDAVSASPTVVAGVVYVGSWDGFFYALDARTGKLVWKFQVDCDFGIIPVPRICGGPDPSEDPNRFFTEGGVITSPAAVVQGKVYFAAGKTVYSLNAADGSLIWKHVICGNPDDPNCTADNNDPIRIFSSPMISQGLVFIGHTADEAEGYRGGFGALDAKTGQLRWHFEVDPVLDANGRVIGGQNRGCGNVWGSAAIDEKQGLVFFGTSDCHHDATPPFHEAVIALKAKTGDLRWVFRPREHDTCDYDFGTTPNVFDIGKHHYVGIGGKDGTYYVLNRLTLNSTGDLAWAKNVVFGGVAGGFFSAAAFDGKHIFSATAIGDFNPPEFTLCSSDPRDTPIQEPSIHAFNAKNGDILWQGTLNHTFAPTSIAHGVIFSGLVGFDVPPALNAYNARTGALLASFPLPGSVNSGVTPVGRMVFVGSGNSDNGQGSGVYAFKLVH